MKRLATEREKEIRSLGDDNEFALFDAKEELLAEIDALRTEISRLHDKYDFQLLVKQRDRYREALERIIAVDGSEFLYPQGPAIAKEALK